MNRGAFGPLSFWKNNRNPKTPKTPKTPFEGEVFGGFWKCRKSKNPIKIYNNIIYIIFFGLLEFLDKGVENSPFPRNIVARFCGFSLTALQKLQKPPVDP